MTPILSLYEFNILLRDTISTIFVEYFWIKAEIASIRLSPRGHCYLELVEKKGNSIIANIRGNIWVNNLVTIKSKFKRVTGEELKSGLKILFLASVEFHPVYSISLRIIEIDPTYTLGEKVLKKKEILERIIAEGWLERNKQITLALVPQKIAVISSETAAGFGDFISHLINNPQKYKFQWKLFQALMQGENAVNSILTQFKKIKKERNSFEMVVLIRGGGSQVDLDCFDNYELAKEIAFYPLPVLTGIGHERDDSITDQIAHTRFKTPTAVAEFLINKLSSFEEEINRNFHSIVKCAKDKTEFNLQRINQLTALLSSVSKRLLLTQNNNISQLNYRLVNYPGLFLKNKNNSVITMEKMLQNLRPENVLKRGYSITFSKNKIIRNIEQIKIDDSIETLLSEGKIISKIFNSEKTNGEINLFKGKYGIRENIIRNRK